MEWPEFLDVVDQAEQKGLFALRGEGTARCFGPEFTFNCAEDRLSMHALPIRLGGESRIHLCAHSMNLPARLASFSWNDTLRANLLADVLVVAFAVDSAIELASVVVVFRRFRVEWHEKSARDQEDAKGIERKTARIAGYLLLLLSAYVRQVCITVAAPVA